MWKPSGAFSEGDNFALRMMKKQGWTQGEGLGKDGGGIAEPIRPSLKFDSSGVGHDPSKEFTSNWWEQAYKKAADKIQVTEDGDEGETHVKTVKKLDKKTIERQKREAKNKLYSQFVQSATLTNGVESKNSSGDNSGSSNSSDDSSDDDDEDKFKRLTDEELFKACGGLTAHKGARHGHKMDAKMKRIQEQEQELLKEMKKSYGVVPNQKSSQVEESQKTSKKRGRSENGEFEKSENDCKSAKKKRKNQTEIEQPLSDFQDQPEKSETECKVSKKKKKKSKKGDKPELKETEDSKSSAAEVTKPIHDFQDQSEINENEIKDSKKKKKKSKKSEKRKSKDTEDLIQSVVAVNEASDAESKDQSSKKKKKSKKDKSHKNADTSENSSESNTVELSADRENATKTEKKSSRKEKESLGETNLTEAVDSIEKTKAKKSKKNKNEISEKLGSSEAKDADSPPAKKKKKKSKRD